MKRSCLWSLALVVAGFTSIAQAELTFQVDGVELPVPPQLAQQWERVLAKEQWKTVTGKTIDKKFRRFVVRRFDVFTTDDGQFVKTTWLVKGKCHTKIVRASKLKDKQKHLLGALFHQPIHTINGRKTADVVFCEFGNGRGGKQGNEDTDGDTTGDDDPLGDDTGSEDTGGDTTGNDDPLGDDTGNEDTEGDTTGDDDPLGDDTGSEDTDGDTADNDDPLGDDTTGDDDTRGDDTGSKDTTKDTAGNDDDHGDDEGQKRQGPGPVVPVRLIAGPGKALLLPFANAARHSFHRRLSLADCRPREDEEEKDEDDKKDEEEKDEDDKKDDGLKKFGFHVKKFKSEAGSLTFTLAKEFDVCIRARDLPGAFRRLRDRFPRSINQADQSRTSFRFRPSNKACAEDKKPKDDAPADDGGLTPFQDPLNDGTESIDDTAIPS